MKKAVALKYPEGVEAPIIVAKGKGKVAEKIIEEARKNDIFIKEDTVLVDMLGLHNAGDFVPEETWTALAEFFSFILSMKNDSENKNQE
ncbi:MAG: EscU/YscU/HrcU family type III secretion system export apparatus switch protein [Treponema sp.]|nr:EscU/YscU/HrcU family type III secretion system export apparatus switch protein [Treponema sp.]